MNEEVLNTLHEAIAIAQCVEDSLEKQAKTALGVAVGMLLAVEDEMKCMEET